MLLGWMLEHPVYQLRQFPQYPLPQPLRLPWRAECLATKGLMAGTSEIWSAQQAVTSCGIVFPSVYTFWLCPRTHGSQCCLPLAQGLRILHMPSTASRERNQCFPKDRWLHSALHFISCHPPPHTREDSLEEKEDEEDRTRMGWEYLGSAAGLGVGPSRETLCPDTGRNKTPRPPSSWR